MSEIKPIQESSMTRPLNDEQAEELMAAMTARENAQIAKEEAEEAEDGDK